MSRVCLYIFIYIGNMSYILYAKVVQIEFPITKTDRFCLLEEIHGCIAPKEKMYTFGVQRKEYQES